MPSNVKDLGAIVAGVDQLAAIFGCSKANVMALSREHAMPRRSHGRYPLVECFTWYLEWLRTRSSRDSAEVAESRLRLYDVQRQRGELDLAQRRGELLDAELVASVIQAILAAIATQMDGLGPRMAGALATIDDPASIQRKLFDECRNIRRNCAAEVLKIGLSLAEDKAGAPVLKKRTSRKATPAVEVQASGP